MDIDNSIDHLEERPAVYVLRGKSERNYLYKGSCRNLPKRLRDHRAGRVSKTKNKKPLELVYFEYCNNYTEARKRENFFKTGKGREFLKARVAEWQTQRT